MRQKNIWPEKNAVVNRITDWILDANMHPNPLRGIRNMVQLAAMQTEFHLSTYHEIIKLPPEDQTWVLRVLSEINV